MSSYVHVYYGTNVRYFAQTKRRGCRTWRTIKETKSKRAALRCASDALMGDVKRARVLHLADYYDPMVVVEMTDLLA